MLSEAEVVLSRFLGATFSSLKNLYLKAQISLLRHSSWPTFTRICSLSSDIYGWWSEAEENSRRGFDYHFNPRSHFQGCKDSSMVLWYVLFGEDKSNTFPLMFCAHWIEISEDVATNIWFLCINADIWVAWCVCGREELHTLRRKQSKDFSVAQGQELLTPTGDWFIVRLNLPCGQETRLGNRAINSWFLDVCMLLSNWLISFGLGHKVGTF